MIGVSRPKKASMPSPEQALATALTAVTRNLVAYSETGDVYSASSDKDKQIKRVTDALARSQADVASQIASKLDDLHAPPVLDAFPADYTRFNYASYRSMLPRILDDLAVRHAQLAAVRNELIDAIRKAQDAAALVTAAKIMTEKAVEKLNASAAGICPPVALKADPAELKPLVPTVKVIEVVETVGVPGMVAAPVTTTSTAHDDHGHGAHDDHGHGGHDDHGHGHGDDHAAATAVATATAASAPQTTAAPATAEPAPAAAAPPPAAEAAPAEAKAEDEDAGFVPTWKVAPLAPLVGGKTNFILASETADAGQLAQLAKDAHHLVRHNVATNPNTPKEVLQNLTGDENRHVRRAAKKRLG